MGCQHINITKGSLVILRLCVELSDFLSVSVCLCLSLIPPHPPLPPLPPLPPTPPEKLKPETHFGAKYVFASHLPLPVEVADKIAYR